MRHTLGLVVAHRATDKHVRYVDMKLVIFAASVFISVLVGGSQAGLFVGQNAPGTRTVCSRRSEQLIKYHSNVHTINWRKVATVRENRSQAGVPFTMCIT